MGYYIDQNSKGRALSHQNKAAQLVSDGAIIIPKPREWLPNLVCVIENGFFDAAGYMYSKNEFEVFADTRDNRPKTWLIYEHAAKLSGYES